ncbi:MAG TPA: histidine phosphatase family protein [Alphaproteobacteria bacterium]|nr:histidine phosphatase family protein [Alphaproteobacteria bacterium]
MTAIALIRHAPTAWNDEGRIQGHSDIPLSPRGRALADEWAVPPELDGFAWVASPLARTRETAALLSGASECPTDPRLMEADWGDWEGRVLAELRAELGEVLARNEARGLDLQPPGGERPRDVRDRFAQWAAETAAAGTSTVAVAHNGVIRAAYSLATGWDMKDDMPDTLRWGAAHLFEAEASGAFAVVQLNIPLDAAIGERSPKARAP